MSAILTGWKAITAHLGLSRHLVVTRGYPVRRQPGGYGVWADGEELDAHTNRLFDASPTLARGGSGEKADQGQVQAGPAR